MWGKKMEILDIKEMICKIDGVLNVKIVHEAAELQEVHILASNLRAPKQIVRDIESSLLAAYDYKIDRKIISIAQIDAGESENIKRIIYQGTKFEVNGNNIDCEVILSYAGEDYSVAKNALKTSKNRKNIVAQATISAIEKIYERPNIFDIQDVLVSSSRDINFVTVIVNMVLSTKEETMIGSAIIRNDINEAIAKASLDAVNRRIQIKVY